VAGGIAVVLSSRLTTAPFRYLWMVLGSVALAATALGLFFLEWAPVAELGEGGIDGGSCTRSSCGWWPSAAT
jgi:hypothetical protein